MQSAKPDSVEFKYKWHDETGAVTSFEHGKGSFDGSVLRLGKLELKVNDIVGLHSEDNTFFLSVWNETIESTPYNIEFYGTDVRQLELAINRARSRAHAKQERTRLTKEGTLDSYREATCPFCEATNLLSGLPETEQVYCGFCDTLYSQDRTAIGDIETHFRICQACGMYSRPRPFAVFYFYYLIFTFGFHHDSIVRCAGCMRSSAWKMVFVNLFGLLGFPFALWQLYRSYSTSKLIGQFEGLDDANVLARRGRVGAALEKYDVIMGNVPENAGVKYNIAAGLLIKQDYQHAQQMFELALDDCSNYWPAVHGLFSSLEKQGKKKEMEAVKKLWDLSGDEYGL